VPDPTLLAGPSRTALHGGELQPKLQPAMSGVGSGRRYLPDEPCSALPEQLGRLQRDLPGVRWRRHRGGGRARSGPQIPGHVPGSGWSILAEPP
jgi:hypothetical protein